MKLLRRKQCLRPTPAGWLVVTLFLAGGIWSAITHVHAFLAPTRVVQSDMMVVEGWLPYGDMEAVIRLARQRDDRILLTTGGPIGQGVCESNFGTYAELGAATLRKLGLERTLYAVPAPSVRKDRTHASALAVKAWLEKNMPEKHSFNLVSHGVHSRRSHLLFREAFGRDFNIGIIALPVSSYDASRWWTSSAGVRTVIGETIAWVYAAFFYSPSEVADD